MAGWKPGRKNEKRECKVISKVEEAKKKTSKGPRLKNKKKSLQSGSRNRQVQQHWLRTCRAATQAETRDKSLKPQEAENKPRAELLRKAVFWQYHQSSSIKPQLKLSLDFSAIS